MMRWIVAWSIQFRFIVVGLAVALMSFGASQLRDQPVDVFPEFAPPRVEVQTACLGLSAVEVESLVTIPLEQALNGVEGLDVIRSKSVADLSSIEMIFKPGTDLLIARQLVQERLVTVTPSLPTWASPPFMMQPLSATSRVMKIGVSSDQHSLIDLSMLSYWKIRSRLLRVPGVANVAIWGERKEMLHVRVDSQRLREEQVSLKKVMEVTSDALDAGLLQYSSGAVVGTGGFVDTPGQRLPVRHVLPIVGPEDLELVSFQKANGSTAQLGDVADVVVDHQPLVGDAVINDGEGILLIVEKFPWANTLDVTRGVESAIGEMRPGLQGVEIDTTIFRPATFIEQAIDNLTVALILGCLLVMLVLIAFLFEWRTAIISVVAIPMSLVAAAVVLYLRDTTVNTMVLAGFVIAVGVVVDDAIIDIENIVRRLRQHRREGSTKAIAGIILESSLEVRSAIIFATLIDIVVLFPIFLLEGLSGAFFQPLAVSYALALLASMVVALTVTPALAMILLPSSPLKQRDPPLMRYLQAAYEGVLVQILRRSRLAILAAVATIVFGLALLPTLGQSLLPEFKERDFLMHWVTRPGSSQPAETRITTQASQELRAISGVRNFGAHIGQALQADEVVGVEFGENWISIDPDADYDETLGNIQDVVQGYPGLYRDVLTYLKEPM